MIYLDGNNRLITLDNSSLLSKFDGYSFAASKLANTRTIWGQSFNGEGNVSGAITGATTGNFSGGVTAGSISLTTPLVVSSGGTGLSTIGTVIASCGSTYALNAAVASSYLIGSRTLQTGTSGTKNIGKDLYIRGTISGQNLVTDGVVVRLYRSTASSPISVTTHVSGAQTRRERGV